ncbi:MAG TPA: SMI1/KNR4 family protein [Kofleriaceae bacterium]|nr:SMI1/KNR4 family protein [Kofleriaceae bacterium]
MAAFERRFGHPLPDDYRRFLLEVNGGYPADENSWIGHFTVNRLFSLCDQDDESRDLETRAGWARTSLPHSDLLFIGHFDGARILLALNGGHRGEVWSQDTVDQRPSSNPRVLWHDRRDMEKVADSFAEFARQLGPLKISAG